ncbi:MAG: hypothetical protein F6K62_06550 [Sphaerospermopsis sp. SIO1G2]|nr:hypothetical protein [Sphaerospermopsis sp. SIO1G1]NET70634.1 hypothetical protein [Sphaerospermopsis sp. SIO1G2]
MVQTSVSSTVEFSPEADVWQNLKYAISTSSGFQSWQLESSEEVKNLSWEQQVQMYLRETLETLAY